MGRITFDISKRILSCWLWSIGFFSPLYAQIWTMPVDGKVFAGDATLTGAIVTLYKNGQQHQQVVTTSNGKFSFELPANAEYLISVTKPGYVTKKFKIVTANVPADRSEAGGLNPFEPDVSLFEMPTAPEISKRVEAILSQPIAIYQFIPSEGNFNYDAKYTQMIQDKLAELAQLQKQAEKEMQEKVKNAALEAQKQLEIDKKYKAAVTRADASFNSKDYNTAKTGYTEASGIKPAETYPKSKLAEVDKLLADAGKQKELDVKYQAAITKADNAFNAKDYGSAKTGYTEASGIKPGETYPKTKLSEIDKLLADANKQKELDAKYQAAIAKADNAFNLKDYNTAKTGYTEASGIKPAEAYPKTKLSEIDKILAAMSKAAEVDKQYKDLIAKADNFFVQKNYSSAKTFYSDASLLKLSELYPKNKIAEIDKLLAELASQKSAAEKEQIYKDAVAKADKLFAAKEYSNAKSAYNEALGIKQSEQYPKDKISEIDKILSAASLQKELDAKYHAAIIKGDNAFNAKDYYSAKSAYTEATGLKPAEAYPKTRLAELEKLIAAAAGASAQKELDAKYQAAIVKADNAFNAKEYSSAKIGYIEASGIKPAETYPKTKLAEIDKLLADAGKQKDIDSRYQAAITKGDNAFGGVDYTAAKAAYIEALGIKPSEQYPKDKLEEISKIEKSNASSQQKENNDIRYNQAIEKADKSFSQKDYMRAKPAYQEALSYKPDEQYPRDKISQIDDIIKKQQQVAKNVPKQSKQNVPELSVEEKTKAYQSELRAKYPNGVTEEEFNDNGRIVCRRVVIKDNLVAVYTRVTHNWGGIYCFKDNVPITEMVFENETR